MEIAGRVIPLPGALAAAALVLALLALALRSPGDRGTRAPPGRPSGPYIERFDGRIARATGGAAPAGASDPGPAVPEGRGRGGASGAASGARSPGRRSREARSRTAVGRELSELMADPQVVVLALSHPQGSFAYHRRDGWLRLVDGGWVVVPYAELPADLKQRYPPQIYGAGRGAGSRSSRPGGCGAACRGSDAGPPAAGGGPGFPLDPEDVAITFLPTLSLEDRP
jgi:hypothetical protein